MSSPLLWLVAQTPKECLCMHVVYGMVGNVTVPIIGLLLGRGSFNCMDMGGVFSVI